jgi:hypothetical protein
MPEEWRREWKELRRILGEVAPGQKAIIIGLTILGILGIAVKVSGRG